MTTPIYPSSKSSTSSTSSSSSALGNSYIYSDQSSQIEKGKEKNKKETKNNNLGEISNIRSKAFDHAGDAITQVKEKKREFKVRSPIKEQRDIFKHSMTLTNSSRRNPLCHFNPQSQNVGDVYINTNAVFKPGELAAFKAKVGFNLTRLLDIMHVVLPSKDGHATVISRIDQDLNGNDFDYSVVQLNQNNVFLIDSERLKNLDDQVIVVEEQKEKGRTTYRIEDASYILVPSNEGWELQEAPNSLDLLIKENNAFKLVEDADGTFYLAADSQIIEDEEVQNEEELTFHGIQYRIEPDANDSDIITLLPENEDEDKLTFQKVKDQDDRDLWVNVDSYFTYDEEEQEEFYQWEGKEYRIENDDGVYSFHQTSENEFETEHAYDRFALISSSRDAKKLLNAELVSNIIKQITATESGEDVFDTLEKEKRKELLSEKHSFDEVSSGEGKVIVDKGKFYVERNGQKYEVIESKNGIKVIGKDIKGMVQEKVRNIFTGQKTATGKVLDLRIDSPERAEFYQRIPMQYFIWAFFATLILRPQDAKISTLDETNVLFSAQPNSEGIVDVNDPTCPLLPVLIDEDEILPENNVSIVVEKEGGKSRKEVNPVRFGLMGFPHARRTLSTSEKEQVFQMIEKAVSNRNEIIKYFERFKKGSMITDKHLKALLEVIDNMEAFSKNHADLSIDWSLQDLCFAALPSYKAQWDQIGDRLSPEKKALFIGDYTIEEIETRIYELGDKKRG